MARDDEGAGAGNLLVAFLLGGVYAPASGRETRDFIGEKAREGRERAGEVAVKGRDVIKQGRETVTTAIERGREAYQQARSRETS
jgi:hypothetical protein